MAEVELVEIEHPVSGERFKVNRADLYGGDDDDLIPLYEMNGEKRSRADAWLGSGRPSDIRRDNARRAYERSFNPKLHT